MHSKKAFTLIEILICVGVLGLLATFTVPKLRGIVGVTNVATAKTMAHGLNGAMFAYYETISGAQTAWTAAADDETKYQLLYGAQLLPNAPATLAGYSPSGFTFTFPSLLTARVVITGSSGVVAY